MSELAAANGRLTTMRWPRLESRWRVTSWIAAGVLCSAVATMFAQAPATGKTDSARSEVVDVIVLDHDGHPVHGLNRADFAVRQDQQGRPVRDFSELIATKPAPVPVLAAGTYTDYVSEAPGEALNVLLVDTLNTPPKQQEALREQVREYVAHSAPGTRVAILALGNKFIQLQGFNADPEALKSAMGHVLIPRAPVLIRGHDGASNVVDPGSMAAQAAANLGLYETDSRFLQALSKPANAEDRGDATLNAFYMLARLLDALPGRKNLVWLAGTFAVDVTAGPEKSSLPHDDEEELRETAALLNHARVALYPADLGSLGQTQPAGTGESAKRKTMEQMARDSGGRVPVGAASLGDVLREVTAWSTDSYALSIDRVDTAKSPGAAKAIEVELSGDAASRGLTLLYPHELRDAGASFTAPVTGSGKRSDVKNIKAEAGAIAGHQAAESSYTQLATTRAAPQPAEMLFSVRVRPASRTNDDAIVPGNSPDPFGRLRGPFRRFVISIQALPTDVSLQLEPNGRWRGKMEFLALDYDAGGKLFNADDREVDLNLTQQTYEEFLHQAVGFRMEISAPVRSEGFLRIAVHDVPSNRYGVVEVPVAAISSLDPDPAP